MQLKKGKNQNNIGAIDLTGLIGLCDTIKGKLSISESATEVSSDDIFYPNKIFLKNLPTCIGNGRYKIKYGVINLCKNFGFSLYKMGLNIRAFGLIFLI